MTARCTILDDPHLGRVCEHGAVEQEGGACLFGVLAGAETGPGRARGVSVGVGAGGGLFGRQIGNSEGDEL